MSNTHGIVAEGVQSAVDALRLRRGVDTKTYTQKEKLIQASEETTKDSRAGALAYIAVARSPWQPPEAGTLLAQRLPFVSTSIQQPPLARQRVAIPSLYSGRAGGRHDLIPLLGCGSRWRGFHRVCPSVLSFFLAPEVEHPHSTTHPDRRLRRPARNQEETVKS